MAGKKKKDDKIVPLVPTTIEEQFESGSDPRDNMTPEQIQEFIRKEEETLARRIGKFAVEVPKPDTSELEVEEEAEIFTLDLEKKTIEQKTDAVIIGEEGLIDKVMAMAPANQYSDLIAGILVSKALANLIKLIKAEQDKVEEMAEKAVTTEQAKALSEMSRVVFNKQLAEIRACWITGTNNVKFDKIPAWAEAHIKRYIDDHLRSLIEFVAE